MTNANANTEKRPFFVNTDSPEKDGLFTDPSAFAQRVLEYPDLPAVLAVGYAGGSGNKYPGVAGVLVKTEDIADEVVTHRLRRFNHRMWFFRHTDGTWLHTFFSNPCIRESDGALCLSTCYIVLYYHGNEDTPASVLERNRRMWKELELPVDEYQTGCCTIKEITDDAGDSRRIIVW